MKEFIPKFKFYFFKPKYWGMWLVLLVGAAMAFVPRYIRDPILDSLGGFVGYFSRNARRRAEINLRYCFPELNEMQREKIVKKMFSVSLQSILLTAELAWLKNRGANKSIVWHNREIIDDLYVAKKNVIFFVPHGFAIDIPGMLMGAEGRSISIIIRRQSNELVDYVWNKLRRTFGCRIHIRDDGIKPFIYSIRQGSWGYYLPDQDHGSTKSQFVDFFATYKATLPVLGRLMKACNATIVPLFPVYNGKTHQLDIFIHPPMNDLMDSDEITQARRMNEQIERFIRPNPEQYNWFLKILKTRKNNEVDPYKTKK